MKYFDIILNACQYGVTCLLSVAEARETLQLIALGFSLVSTVIIAIPKIINIIKKLCVKIKAWKQKALQDGKITQEETKELIEHIGSAVEEIADTLPLNKGAEENGKSKETKGSN